MKITKGYITAVSNESREITVTTGEGITNIVKMDNIQDKFSLHEGVELISENGVLKIRKAKPVYREINDSKFVNFYFDTPSTDMSSGTVGEIMGSSYADLPPITNSIKGETGEIVYISDREVGLVVSPTSKFILRDDGVSEQFSIHFASLQGRHVFVSSLPDDITIRLEIANFSVDSPVDLDEIKQSIYDLMMPESNMRTQNNNYVPNKTYTQAFLETIANSSYQPFLKFFGLQLSEILLTLQIKKIEFSGSMSAFSDIFSSVGDVTELFSYTQSAYRDKSIESISFDLSTSGDSEPLSFVRVPDCQSETIGQIKKPEIKIGGQVYKISFLSIRTQNGNVTEYSANKRVYASTLGTLCSRQWTSSNKSALYSEVSELSFNNVIIPNINISKTATGFCGDRVPISNIIWDGSLSISVTEDFSIFAGSKIELNAADSTLIAGGGRGIKVDRLGSSAVTL